MEGRFSPDLPIKTEIALYDHVILQLQRELARSKETERDLNDKWYQSAMKSIDQLRRLKNLKTMNRLLNEFLQHKTDELKEVMVANLRLDEMVMSKQNAVNFSRSQLEKVQRENDILQSRVRQLKQKAE